jgi:O-antigen ligase
MMVDVSLGGKFNVAHNSYLQALVELGIAGLILFLRMYYLSFRGLQRARSALITPGVMPPEKAEQALFARALQFSLAGNMVCVFFLTEIYMQLLWVIFGVCMALLTVTSPGTARTTSAKRTPARLLRTKYLPSVRRSSGRRSGETQNETQNKS